MALVHCQVACLCYSDASFGLRCSILFQCNYSYEVKFLWINDLSTYDPIISWNHNLWLIGDHLSLTCILFCSANILYTWFTMQQQKDQMVGQQADQMKVMQYMMFLMPVFFFFMFNDYSSGLNFYYCIVVLLSCYNVDIA